MIFFTVSRLLPPTSNVLPRESAWLCRVCQGHILHGQIVQQTIQHFFLRRRQVPSRLFLKHSQHVDPVFTLFEINVSLVSNRVFHHSQGRRSIRRERHKKVQETGWISGIRQLFFRHFVVVGFSDFDRLWFSGCRLHFRGRCF